MGLELDGSPSQLRPPLKTSLHEVAERGREAPPLQPWLRLVAEVVEEHGEGVHGAVGVPPRGQLIDAEAKAPDVGAEAVVLAKHTLRRHMRRGVHEGVADFHRVPQTLGDPKVGDLYGTL